MRRLARLLTESVEAEQRRLEVAQRRWHTPLREIVPMTDRAGKPAKAGGAKPAGGGKGGKGLRAWQADRAVRSLNELEQRLYADLRSHHKAFSASAATKKKRRAARAAEAPQTSTWLAKAGEGLASADGAAGGGAKRAKLARKKASSDDDDDDDSDDSDDARKRKRWWGTRTPKKQKKQVEEATLDSVLAALLTPAAWKAWVKEARARAAAAAEDAKYGDSMHEGQKLVRAVLPAAAAELGDVRAAQEAARALRSLSTDEHDGDAAWEDDDARRALELRALAESTFWHELAAAVPSLIDLVVSADDAMRTRLGRALRAACSHYVAAAQRPERSPLVAIHHHPRLIGLRYAPLLREEHRPLLLRFLALLAAATEELRTREALLVVPMRPPPFMGPPVQPPTGALVPPPPTLARPKQLHPPEPSAAPSAEAADGAPAAALAAGAAARAAARAADDAEARSFVRPHLMSPPRGAPNGPKVKPPPRLCDIAALTPIRPARMLAPQQLATLRQLLRRIAAATAADQQRAPPSAAGLLNEFGSVVRKAVPSLSMGRATEGSAREVAASGAGSETAGSEAADSEEEEEGAEPATWWARRQRRRRLEEKRRRKEQKEFKAYWSKAQKGHAPEGAAGEDDGEDGGEEPEAVGPNDETRVAVDDAWSAWADI